jgi:tetratricopeptide (TPR) repeat protein
MAAGKEHFQKGDYAAAQKRFLAALELARDSNGPPSEMAIILGSLGQIHLGQSQLKEAAEYYEQALRVARKSPLESRIKATVLVGAATLYTQMRRYDLAETLLQESVGLTRQAFGEQSAQNANALKQLGILYGLTGRLPDAEKLLKRALGVQDALANGNAADTAAILSSLASVYTLRGKWGQAEPIFLRSVELMEKTLRADHPDVAPPLDNLAGHYEERRNFRAAESVLRRALNIRLKAFGPDSLPVALSNARLASALAQQNQLNEARTLFTLSLSTQERFEITPEYITTLERFARLLRKMEDRGQAETYEARAKYIRAELSYTVPASQLVK